MNPTDHSDDPMPVSDPPTRPMHELRDTGLLWLINRVVLHPRGYALALIYDRPQPTGGNVIGWCLHGDGSEPWSMGDPPDEMVRRGYPTEDQLFARVQDLLRPPPSMHQVFAADARSAADRMIERATFDDPGTRHEGLEREPKGVQDVVRARTDFGG